MNFILPLTCLLCMSCGRFHMPDDEAPVLDEITVRAEIGSETRAVSENGIYKSFEAGDTISLFVWTGTHESGPLTEEQTVVNNVLNRFVGEGEWTPETPMHWATADDGSIVSHSFAAIYPSVMLSDPYLLKGAYTAVDGKVEDVLVARVDGQEPTPDPVNLTFNHAMASIEVILTIRNELDGIDPESVSVTVEAAADAEVDYVSGKSSAVGQPVLYELAASADGLHHRAVLPEQTLPMNLVVHVGEQTRTLKRDGLDLVLQSGLRTTVSLTVGKDKVELAPGDSGIIVGNWTDGRNSDLGTE